jgi:hypothetical protein
LGDEKRAQSGKYAWKLRGDVAPGQRYEAALEDLDETMAAKVVGGRILEKGEEMLEQPKGAKSFGLVSNLPEGDLPLLRSAVKDSLGECGKVLVQLLRAVSVFSHRAGRAGTGRVGRGGK